jgi:hypothetical protein
MSFGNYFIQKLKLMMIHFWYWCGFGTEEISEKL